MNILKAQRIGYNKAIKVLQKELSFVKGIYPDREQNLEMLIELLEKRKP